MMDDNCIFCKIAQGDIPSTTVYEDEEFRAIMDLSPIDRGHVLIIPKKHCRNIFDMDDATAAKVFCLTAKLARAMKKGLNCDGMNVVQNNEEIAGQSVFHFHMHLIPRYEGKGVVWGPGTSTPEELKEQAEAIKAQL